MSKFEYILSIDLAKLADGLAMGKGTSSVILRRLFEQLVSGDVTCQMEKPRVGAEECARSARL